MSREKGREAEDIGIPLQSPTISILFNQLNCYGMLTLFFTDFPFAHQQKKPQDLIRG